MKTIKKKLCSILLLVLSVMMISCASMPANSSVSDSTGSQSSIENGSDSQDKGNDEDNSISSNFNNSGEELKIHYIDVGQADCILLQQGDENMLIDAGNNDDEQTIKNYLQSAGVNEFEYVVGTHPHEDHIGSMDYIMNSFKVGKIYFPKAAATSKTFENLVNAVKNKNMQFTEPVPGETFNLGQAKCTILAPNSSKYEDLNNYSIVLKVEFGNNSFLFTGDAEDVSEKEMLSKGFDLKADVLKIGHHGSRSSTTREFLNAVNPKYAVISVGKGNDYGHPNDETIEKLHAKGIETYRTDESGTIVAVSDGNNISFNTSLSTDRINSDSSENRIDSSNEETSTNDSNYSKDDSKSNSSQNTSNENMNTNTNSSVNSNAGSSSSQTVWIANDKTKVYHSDKTCSNMKSPKEITLEEAQSKGLRPCSKCGK
ncbi:MAG: ComEC/Rec2 family competence protein [Clostridium sp.]|nr:ComEC/Rec2 family competence protein [Clostridium sp.]